jgi:uncharacterized membrane protein
MKRFVITVMVVLAGFLVGGGLGGYFTYVRFSQHSPVIRGFEWLEIGTFVSENEFDSNSIDATKVMNNTLYLYDRAVQSSTIDPSMKSALRMHRGEIEAQLSVLEREAGDQDQASSYMSKAQADMKDVGWIDYSEANLLKAFPRQPSPCASSSRSTATNVGAKKPCG